MSEFGLVLIGGGNMGAALLTGLTDTGTVDAAEVAVVEIDPHRRTWLEERFPGVAVLEAMPSAAAAIVATKPGDAPAAATAAAAAGARRLLSIAAGVGTAALDAAAGSGVAVIRAMPNLAALVGHGAAAIAPGSAAGDDDLAWAESILGSVGSVARLDESDLDAFTALAGSGPGYLFAVAEHLVAAGVASGLPEGLSGDVVRSLFAGVAAMLAGDADPGELRRQVTSPGGTTAAGLAVLDDRDVRAALVDAVSAATARSRELGTA